MKGQYQIVIEVILFGLGLLLASFIAINFQDVREGTKKITTDAHFRSVADMVSTSITKLVYSGGNATIVSDAIALKSDVDYNFENAKNVYDKTKDTEQFEEAMNVLTESLARRSQRFCVSDPISDEFIWLADDKMNIWHGIRASDNDNGINASYKGTCFDYKNCVGISSKKEYSDWCIDNETLVEYFPVENFCESIRVKCNCDNSTGVCV